MDDRDFRLENLAESKQPHFFRFHVTLECVFFHHLFLLFLFPPSLSLLCAFLPSSPLSPVIPYIPPPHSFHFIPFFTSCSLSLPLPPPPTRPSLLPLGLPTGRRTARFHPLPRKQGPKFRAAVVDLAAGDGSTEGGPAPDSNIVLNRRNFNLIRVRTSIFRTWKRL